MACKQFLTLLLGSLCLVGGLAVAPSNAADQGTPAGAAKASPSKDQIAHWIAALDDDHYLVRERATEHLLTAGAAALDPLLAVANSGRPEPADRAIWVLRRLGRAPDDALAVAALERVVQLKGRPAIVAKADSELGERSLAMCEQRLEPLGAKLTLRTEQFDLTNIVRVLQVRLGPNWHGTPEDLRAVTNLSRQLYFDLEGSAIDDSVAKMFEARKKLAYVRFTNTKISPAAIDALKQRHPDAMVLLRNHAKLGVGGQSNASGVLVSQVEPNSGAAAAGIAVGDVITTLDGQPVKDFDRLTVQIAQHRAGDKVDVEVIRNGKKMKLPVTLGKWADEE
jgi:PDZ domain